MRRRVDRLGQRDQRLAHLLVLREQTLVELVADVLGVASFTLLLDEDVAAFASVGQILADGLVHHPFGDLVVDALLGPEKSGVRGLRRTLVTAHHRRHPVFLGAVDVRAGVVLLLLRPAAVRGIEVVEQRIRLAPRTRARHRLPHLLAEHREELVPRLLAMTRQDADRDLLPVAVVDDETAAPVPFLLLLEPRSQLGIRLDHVDTSPVCSWSAGPMANVGVGPLGLGMLQERPQGPRAVFDRIANRTEHSILAATAV